jgi:hypothetical protein
MSAWHHDSFGVPGQTRSGPASPRRSPALTLQRAIGNRGMTQLLARKGTTNEPTFERSVRLDKLGPIEIAESNVDDWIAQKASAEDLVVTTVAGKHSAELKQMSGSKARVETLEVQVLTGQNTWVTVTFKNALVRDYALAPSGKTETWKAVRFDKVDIKRLAIGKPRK